MAFCGNCGTSLSGPFCMNCGTPAGESRAAAQSATPPTEELILEEGGILISTSRFATATHTFAMSGITSVSATEFQPSRKGPVIAILIGLGLFIMMLMFHDFPPATPVFGIGFVAVGGWLVSRRVPVYSVMLSNASGQAVKATSSGDKVFTSRVVAATNEAIIRRG